MRRATISPKTRTRRPSEAACWMMGVMTSAKRAGAGIAPTMNRGGAPARARWGGAPPTAPARGAAPARAHPARAPRPLLRGGAAARAAPRRQPRRDELAHGFEEERVAQVELDNVIGSMQLRPIR